MAEIGTPTTEIPMEKIQKPTKPGSELATILLVDDDRGLSALMSRYLGREGGIRVIPLYSGASVLEWLEKQRADLMIIDYLLPDMNGKELVRALDEKGLAVPFITVTGQGDERLAVEMVKLGAMDYLVKDQIMLDLLPSVVRNALTQLKQARQLKETEERRQDSEARYRGIFNASIEPILILDLKGQLVDANGRACELTGMTLEELQQKRFCDLLAEEESGVWNKLLWEVSEKNGFSGETLLVRQDGTQVDVEVCASCLGEADMQGHLLLFIRDICERKWAEEELKLTNEQLRISEQALSEREGRLRSIFQGSAIGIVLLDMEGRAVECNDYLRELLGYEGGELRQMHFADLNHPEDRGHAEVLLDELIAGKRKRFQAEKRLCCKDGQPVWVRVTASRVRSEERKMDYIIKIVENVNDRKQVEASLQNSEWKFRTLFDNMNHGFLYNQAIRDETGRITDYLFLEANQAVETLLLLSRNEMVGRRVSELKKEDCASLLDWIDTYGKAALAGKDIHFEHFCERSGRWLAVTVYRPQEDFFATIIEDVTLQHQLQDELAAYTKQVQQSRREMEMILGGISQKMRKPVKTLMELTDGQAGQQAAVELAELMDELEQYAGVLSTEEPFAPVDLGELVLELVSKREGELHTIGAQLDIQQLPMVWGCRSMLADLLGRLLNNAVRFRSERPLALQIGAKPQGERWKISVSDNGQRLDSSHTEADSETRELDKGWRGSGVGLALCKQIVSLHDGQIGFEAGEEEGMTVWFTLAAQREKPAD